MKPEELKLGRKRTGLTQNSAASKLGVSQPYLSLLESGKRSLSGALARRAARLFGLPSTVFPLPNDLQEPPRSSNENVAKDLAALGYPGFSYLRPGQKRNPAQVLFTALGQNDLEPRLTEALPWVVLNYADLDWNWLVPRVKSNDLQNRLGFVTSLAQRVAASHEQGKADWLAQREAELDRARLVQEGTLCHDSLTEAEKSWLRDTRPEEAKHWNLLTDLTPKYLSYAA